jgi:hypothetical protein
LPTPENSDEAATKGYVDSQPFGADNILITDVSNNDLLQYDASLSKWKNVRGLALQNTGSTTNVFVTANNVYETVDNSINFYDNSTTTIDGTMVVQSTGGGTSFTVEEGAVAILTGDMTFSSKQ